MNKTHLIEDESLGGTREYKESPEKCFGYGDYVIVKHPDYKDFIARYHEELVAPSGCHIVLLEPITDSQPLTLTEADVRNNPRQVIDLIEVKNRKLVKNYRGWFSNHADDVNATIKALKEGAQ